VSAELELTSRSPAETEALGERLGRALGPGAVVALFGDLGSGKTCLVRGLARGLGVAGPVSSPTYVLMQEYAGRLPLYHFDAWMQGREATFLEGGGAEWLHAGGVAVVEWADRVLEWLPEPRLELRLVHRGPEERRVAVRAVGDDPALTALLEGLRPRERTAEGTAEGAAEDRAAGR